ncbi:ATP-grasp domain-containing protein [Thiohalobacter thiocyanaticus]|uniref:ATP-grasp domain-containing protein n=1 Tax=Thiohalobacter thiocyanaticus TaxID=585455 RepID=A0A426QLV4_9GAMM|nr:ATP-grasp domain-containing protein [Thiohalobacter thiocyanaticus]RRQ22743.1 ATP-grasp domain-containing protein [Thiohalobacter thiocyanaticus]
MPRNVFILGLNDFNRRLLETIGDAGQYRFLPLLDNADLEEPEVYRVREQLDAARAHLRAFPGHIDAIIGYIDMPVGLMVPILCREFGLPTATLESVLQCQHKYWSRLQQRRVIPEHIPHFNLVNPYAPDAASQIQLDYPFWLKPVKSAGAYLGFRVHNRRQLEYFLQIIRRDIQHVSQPLNHILDYAELPTEIAGIDFNYCIAEQLIGGRQCTLEGYVYNGEFRVFGVVDSIRHANRTSFTRYEYPSKLPQRITQAMTDITRAFLKHIDFDNSTFNVEFFWDQRRDRVWLLEVNTRISQSHSYLFAMVDGASNHQAMVEIGAGTRPTIPHRQGKYRYAAKCFLRKFEDAIVQRVPDADQIKHIQESVPDTMIKMNVSEGTKLWHLREQESYSYEIAWIFVAANTRQQLQARYRKCVEGLDIRFSDVVPSEANDM